MSEPIYLSFTATLVDAPKDMQAAACIQQVFDHLELDADARRVVLKYMTERADYSFSAAV